MFTGDIDARLNELNAAKVYRSDSFFSLEEDMNTDNSTARAKVVVKLRHPAVLFKSVDKNTIRYLNLQECADFIALEQIDASSSGRWKLHIFEFKRTVRTKLWPDKIKTQFLGAYLNALCYAGYLNINIHEVVVYTCYRFDRISDPTALRLASHEPNSDIGNAISQWRNGTVTLQTEFQTLTCIHKPIQVDENFEHEFAI